MNKGKKSRKPRKTSGKSEKEQLEAADEMVKTLVLGLKTLTAELSTWRTAKKC